jgi:8-oxo-dGTP diphosphatase
MNYPGIGVGVYVRKDGKVLMGLRKSPHGRGQWAAPGGKMDMFEDPEACARRELAEETGLEVGPMTFMGLTNDIWDDIGTHYVTLWYVADWKEGVPRVTEPEKCERWDWCEWDKLPEPLFLSTRNFIKSGYNPLKI